MRARDASGGDSVVTYLFWVRAHLHTLVCLDFNNFSNVRVQFSVIITFPFKYIFFF